MCVMNYTLVVQRTFFGNQIVMNLKNNSTTTPKMPVLDEENGSISYLGKKYSVVEVNV